MKKYKQIYYKFGDLTEEQCDKLCGKCHCAECALSSTSKCWWNKNTEPYKLVDYSVNFDDMLVNIKTGMFKFHEDLEYYHPTFVFLFGGK